MDFLKQQILKKIDYLSQSTKNFQWFFNLLVENGILRDHLHYENLVQERDPVAKMRTLYLALLDKRVHIEMEIFLILLRQCRNEHLLPCFTGKIQTKPIDVNPVKPKNVQLNSTTSTTKLNQPKKKGDPLSTWKLPPNSTNQPSLEDAQVFLCLAGRRGALHVYQTLPNFAKTLTTIKLKYCVLPWSSVSAFSSCGGDERGGICIGDEDISMSETACGHSLSKHRGQH